MTENFAFLTLLFLRGITLPEKRECVQRSGSALATLQAKDPHNQRLNDALFSLPEAQQRAESELAFAEAHQIELIPFTSLRYPASLRESKDAPLLLFFKGRADLNPVHALSIVGTRHITEYGKDCVKHFVEDLQRVQPDTLIVSGLAYGVDIHAHRHALH